MSLSIIIDVQNEEDIRVGCHDDIQRGRDIRVRVFIHKIGQQQTGPVAGKRAVKYGKAQRLRNERTWPKGSKKQKS